MWLDDDAFRRLCRAREQLGGQDSLAEVARAAGMSPFHFGRRFAQLFGATPHRWRSVARVERARRMLAAGELSVTEVCLELGFSSLGSFSTLFRRHVGVSPAGYRRRVLVSVPELRFPGCLSLMAFLPADAFRSFREAPAASIAADCPA